MRRGLWASLAAGAVILALIPSIAQYGLFSPLNLSMMSALVAVAVVAFRYFSRAVGSPLFDKIGVAVISAAAAGVVMLWAGIDLGAAVIAIAYWGEPVMGYFIYRRLEAGLWRAVFLASAAAYAYTLPLVLLGLWQIPELADAVKVVALIALLRPSVPGTFRER